MTHCLQTARFFADAFDYDAERLAASNPVCAHFIARAAQRYRQHAAALEKQLDAGSRCPVVVAPAVPSGAAGCDGVNTTCSQPGKQGDE